MGERLLRGSECRAPAALENFVFFSTEIASFFRTFLIKIDAYEMWHKNYQCKNIIKLVAY